MKLTTLKNVFKILKEAPLGDWQLSALRINRSQRTTEYEAHAIILSPVDAMADYLAEICDRYVGGIDPLINDETDVVEHDGSLHETPVEYLPRSDCFFDEDYEKLCMALSNPEVNGSPLCIKPNAIALRYEGNDRRVKRPIYIIFKKSPFSIFKNRFYRKGDVFSPLKSEVLTLPIQMDLMIAGGEVFVFSSSGSGVANDNAAERNMAERKLKELSTETFIAGFAGLEEVGSKRKNVRIFKAMNEERKSRLREDKQFCTRMAKRFSIPCKNGVMDASNPDDAERLLKLLCKRGMIDPFADDAVEVSGSCAWKKGK